MTSYRSAPEATNGSLEDVMKRFALIVCVLLFCSPIFAQQPDPVSVVAHVLELSDDQLKAWSVILQAREAAMKPIAEQAQAKQEALGHALADPNPDPLAIGNAFIELHRLQYQIGVVNAQGATDFQHLLNEDQMQRLDGIRGAAQVCPIVPALTATGLM
jgi:Heavy-metal resistance